MIKQGFLLSEMLKIKKKMKLKLVIAVMFVAGLMSNNIYGQKDGVSFNANVGFPTVILDGSGVFALSGGLGVEKSLSEKWSLEGQLNGAYLKYDLNNAALEHNGGYNSFATLGGGLRYYWNGATTKHPIYTNVAVGGGFRLEEEYNADNVLQNYNSAAFSVGSSTFIALNNRILLGAHFDIVSGGNESIMILGAKIGVNF